MAIVEVDLVVGGGAGAGGVYAALVDDELDELGGGTYATTEVALMVEGAATAATEELELETELGAE